jgi:hypothetical protein
MTPTSIPSPQFVTKPWRCHGTLIRRLRAPPRLLVPLPPRVCRHFHLLSRRHLLFPSALADCHIHLTSTIFSITRSPAPCLFFSVPICPLSAPDNCHIAASCCAIASCQLAPDVRWRQQQHCRHHSDVVVVVARASNFTSASCSHPPQPFVVLPPIISLAISEAYCYG